MKQEIFFCRTGKDGLGQAIEALQSAGLNRDSDSIAFSEDPADLNAVLIKWPYSFSASILDDEIADWLRSGHDGNGQPSAMGPVQEIFASDIAQKVESFIAAGGPAIAARVVEFCQEITESLGNHLLARGKGWAPGIDVSFRFAWTEEEAEAMMAAAEEKADG